MTREERVEKLRCLIACMKCEVSGKVCDDNCPTQYNAGNMGEIIENLKEIVKILEQEPTTKNDLGVDREDAVERLNALKQLIGYDKDSEIVKATQKSLEMAIKALEQEPTTKNYLSEEDILELKHRYGDEVEFVVRDMISGEGKRWE